MDVLQPIAVVGMAGRFPAAEDVDEFWENLRAGRDCLSTLSDDELLAWGEQPERLADPAYVRRRPRLDGADTFDAGLFGMTPREAEVHDPQHRLFLEVVHSALEHGGYDPASYPGAIGVYAGANGNWYRFDHVERNRQIVDSMGHLAVSIGGASDYLSTFASYKLGLRGPSMTVLTACSTSLVAVHVACVAIRAGDCDMAVAGGVDLEFPLNLGYRHLPGGVEAQDGVPRPFDRYATGTNFGNGAGAVLLKPLATALADGDTVYAVIRGSAINNDGDRKVGFSAPSVAGQRDCVLQALRNARVDPRDISYVEAHATATPVGDPIELAGLIEAYRAGADGPLPHQYCDIGSVKSNIGHLSQAAGVAGLIKTVLALWHEELPPSLHLREPNPATDWEHSPFRVVTARKPWPRVPGATRIAGVSSFGIGGTNSHVVVEQAPEPAGADTSPPHRPEAVLWSAIDESAVDQLRDRLAGYFDRLPDEAFPHAAHTLRVGRTARGVRRAVVAGDAATAAAALRNPDRVLRHDGVDRPVVFAFPGQGAQHPSMLRDLYEQEPIFRQGCDAAFDLLASELETDLRAVWVDGDEAALARTEVAQPLLFTLEYTLAHCLTHWGVAPRAVFGHSVGELVAAAVAGVFDFESGLRAVAARARLMGEAPPGRMVAVAADLARVREIVGQDCPVAAVNGARQVVLAGPAEAVDAASELLRRHRLPVQPLRTSHAFHTPAMAGAADRWQKVLAGMVLHPPEVPIVSAATGKPVGEQEATSPEFWAGQLVHPVDFDTAAAVVLADGPVTVVEVGPGRTLTSLLRGRREVRAGGSRVESVAPSTRGPGHRLAEVLAGQWVAGGTLRYWDGGAAVGYRRIAAPGYPYQRRRYWLEREPAPPAAATGEPVEAAVRVAPAPAGPAIAEPVRRTGFAELEWFPDRTRAGRAPGVRIRPPRGTAVVFGAPAARRDVLTSALGRAGYRPVHLPYGDGATDPGWWTDTLAAVGSEGEAPALVVHAATLAAAPALTPDLLDTELDRSIHSLYACGQALARLVRAQRWDTSLLVIGHHLVDVSGGEPVDPAAAGVPALLRTLAQEVPGLTVRCRDVSAGTPAELLADEIAGSVEPLAALRGGTRWLPRLRELPVDPVPGGSRLRHRGVYLITGGLGGIGLVVARALAATGLAPRLGLLGRTGVPGDDSPESRQVRAELAAFADLGVELEVVRADVTDLAGLAAAVAAVERRFGTIHGVVHSAGIAGGGLFERRDPEEVRRVLAPKTRGVLNLEAVFADRPELDFLMLFSSQNALGGLYGSADNAAGNAFLDAYARSVAGRERHTVSVQWPAWAQVGMAARSNIGIRALHRAAGSADAAAQPDRAAGEVVGCTRVYRPGVDWELDEHAAGGVGVLPGTALLELAVLAARAVGGHSDQAPLTLRDVVFLQAVRGDHPVEVRVLLRPAGEGHEFRAQSRAASGASGWVEHARGVVVPGSAPPPTDLEAVRRRTTRGEAADLSFADWLVFGPRWFCVTDTWHGDGETLARLRLPAEFHADLAEHPLHPAMLDTATGILHDIPPGRSCVPFHYRAVRVFGSLSAELLVHARFTAGASTVPSPVDLDFHDARTGALLVRMEGFTRREFGGEVAGDGEVAGADESGLLSVDDGAAAFLTLLSAPLPPVVTVSPPGERFRVAGVPWADEPVGAGEAPTLAGPPVPAGGGAATPGRGPAPVPDRLLVEEQADGGASERSGVTAILRELWMDTLGVPEVADDDDFFALGGNSLIAVTLANRIKERIGVDLGAGALFEYSTIGAIADEVCR